MTKPITHVLHVEVTASDEQTLVDMVEQLARTACDIANSTEDEHATIVIWDDDKAEDSHLPVGTEVQ
jgi:hypothetical protein